MTAAEKYGKYLLTIYVYVSTCLHGWQVIAFFTVYGSLRENLIGNRMQDWYSWQPAVLTAAILVHLLFYIFFRVAGGRLQPDIIRLKRQLLLQGIMLLTASLSLVLFWTGDHINQLDLAAVVLSVVSLYYLGAMLYYGSADSWRFPTTVGASFTTGVLAGWSLAAATGLLQAFSLSLLVLLGFDLLIVYARFRALSQATPETREIARQLLGRYVFLFGIRLIAGIFIPAIFTVYGYFHSTFSLEGTGSLILTGIFFEKFILVSVTDNVSENEIGT